MFIIKSGGANKVLIDNKPPTEKIELQSTKNIANIIPFNFYRDTRYSDSACKFVYENEKFLALMWISLNKYFVLYTYRDGVWKEHRDVPCEGISDVKIHNENLYLVSKSEIIIVENITLESKKIIRIPNNLDLDCIFILNNILYAVNNNYPSLIFFKYENGQFTQVFSEKNDGFSLDYFSYNSLDCFLNINEKIYYFLRTLSKEEVELRKFDGVISTIIAKVTTTTNACGGKHLYKGNLRFFNELISQYNNMNQDYYKSKIFDINLDNGEVTEKGISDLNLARANFFNTKDGIKFYAEYAKVLPIGYMYRGTNISGTFVEESYIKRE